MATENFESMKALHVRISRSSFILVCHMYQLNQVDYVDFWWIFQYHSLVSILNISTSSFPLKLRGGGREVHFRLLSIRALVLKKVNCFWNNLHFLCGHHEPFNSHDLIVNSPLLLIHISLKICYENLVVDQDNSFYPISESILITCLLYNVWILEWEVIC